MAHTIDVGASGAGGVITGSAAQQIGSLIQQIRKLEAQVAQLTKERDDARAAAKPNEHPEPAA